MEPRESAPPQCPEGRDCSRDGSGDRSHVAQLERTRLQNISSTSNATKGRSRTKGKRRDSEPHGSMELGTSASGSINVEMNRRKRLSLGQKLELLELLGAGTTKAEVARRYGCSEVTVRHIAAKKSELQRRKESPGFNGKAKGAMQIRFPQVEDKVKKMVEDARMHQVPVTRRVVMDFGRVVKTQVLDSNGISKGERARLASFGASENWARNFIKRNGLVRKVLHTEAGDVDREAVKEGNNTGSGSDDDLDSTSKDFGRQRKTPHELSMLFDSLHGHAMGLGSPNAHDLLRQLREEFIPGSVEEHIRQSHETNMAEMADTVN